MLKIYCPDIQKHDIKSKYCNPIILNLLKDKIGSAINFEEAKNLEDADFVSPSYTYTYYYNNKSVHLLNDWAEKANSLNTKLLIWHIGDLEPAKIENTFFLQTSVDRSRNKGFRTSVPFFIEDPIKSLYNGKIVDEQYTKKPKVSFCGYAGINYFKVIYSIIHSLKEHLFFRQDPYIYTPSKLIPAVLIRAQILNLLKRDKRINDDFIIRDNFNAGKKTLNNNYAKGDSDVKSFFENIVNNQYVLCVRGFGNYSVRFFETLACGRIPIFINMDGELPFEDKIIYKKHCVWVNEKEIKNIGNILLEFHNNLNAAKMIELQNANRKLWVENLSFEGFFQNFEKLSGSKI